MAAIRCSPQYTDFLDKTKRWADSDKARELFKDPYAAAYNIAELEFNTDYNIIKRMDITDGQVRSYEHRLFELGEAANRGQISGFFGELLWQSSHFGKKDPIVGKMINNLQHSGQHYRKTEVENMTVLASIIDHVNREAAIRQDLSKYGIVTKAKYNMAKNRYFKLENSLLKAKADFENDVPGAGDEIARITKQMSTMVRETHLKVFDEMIDVIELGVPKVLKAKFDNLPEGKQKQDIRDGTLLKLNAADLAKLELPDGSKINDGKHENLYKAVSLYVGLMDQMYGTLRRGVEKRIDSFINIARLRGDDIPEGTAKAMKKRLRDSLMPKYENQGYFPHYRRDLHTSFMDGLMPMFDEMQKTSNIYSNKEKKSVQSILGSLNTYIDGHVKSRADISKLKEENRPADYNRNFLSVMNSYIGDVNRFNFSAHVDAYFLESLDRITKIYKTNGNTQGYADNIVNHITDLHQAANGDQNMSENTRNLMRTVLGFEFISKIGLNPRSAARNAFQRMLDYVEWGPIQISKLKHQLKTRTFTIGDKEIDSEAFVEKALQDAGLLFTEASPELLESEIRAPASLFKTIQFNKETDKFEAVTQSRLESVANGVSKLAAKTSWLHRAAENKNRRHTFEIAFSQMKSWLDSPGYTEDLNKISQKRYGKDISDKDRESTINRKAKQYAINMVVLNHFDYADYSKSRALRHPVGKVLGQFQHFSFEFFERNLKVMREAKHDVLSGHLLPNGSAQGLQKAYRMALAYFIAPVLAASLLGVDFGNLVEHDTAQRIKQFTAYFLGDEEEREQAFYGKGPLLATAGGPLISDILDMGVMLEFINIDEDSRLAILTGLEKYDPDLQSSTVTKMIRILNTSLGRTVERHIPSLTRGGMGIGTAIQQELGLYPTAKARKAQETQRKLRAKILPKDVAALLDKIEAGEL